MIVGAVASIIVLMGVIMFAVVKGPTIEPPPSDAVS